MNDFWLMIWKMECSVISMITKLREKHKEKCVQYWPTETSGQERYGDVVVTFDSEIERNGYRRTTLYISYKGCRESRKITHFWFTSWPDHKVPSDTRPILSLIQEVRELQKTCTTTTTRQRVPHTPTTPHTSHTTTTDIHTCPTTCPVTVHCSAGRGRTGCFIAISMGMNMIDNEDSVDILKIVSRIRLYRGGLVDKVHQYIFLYKTLFDYWTLKQGLPLTSPLTLSLLTSPEPDISATTLQDSQSELADGESSQVEDPSNS
jgi:receptor-type tyrosine-protein phosphatase R